MELENIRRKLERMEDSIIFSLFERSQYKRNDKLYVPGAIKINSSENMSFLDYMLFETEKVHASAGRYDNPEEHSFFGNLPLKIVDRKAEWTVKKTGINLNSEIKKIYLDTIPKICEKGDDNEYGSSALCDINCLQNISKRVHYGTFVAESKFLYDSNAYKKLIGARDRESIKIKLRNEDTESKILERVKEKGIRYGIDSKFIANFYKEKIIPMTINAEIEYLMKRII